MKANEAVILWTPARGALSRFALAGRVHVCRYGHYAGDGHDDLWDAHQMKQGACDLEIRKATGHTALAYLFILFNTMTVRDGIDPRVAHNALMAIDEYKASVSPEIERVLEPA